MWTRQDLLSSFFEIGTDKSLFDSLYISGNKALCGEYMGKYPVIFLSFKGVDGLDFATARRMLCAILKDELDRHYYLKMALLFAGNGAGWLERNYKLAVIVAGHTVRCEQ